MLLSYRTSRCRNRDIVGVDGVVGDGDVLETCSELPPSNCWKGSKVGLPYPDAPEPVSSLALDADDFMEVPALGPVSFWLLKVP